ncbi:MAG: sugar MFS transporter [Luteimonas sp.]|nr:sugar MFS transporter [Luteimonas sp.]
MPMPSAPAPTMPPQATGAGLRPALVLVTSLFFLWGFSYGLLDVLNKHFQETLDVTRARSALLQAAYFGAYFLMALPAAKLMERFGYKTGILLGLGLFACGALLFIPATGAGVFEFFLFALFVIACGLACLETAANPYVTVLGPAESSARRLNLSQSFNGLGSFVAPLVGGKLFFGSAASGVSGSHAVQATYVAIAAVVLVIAVLVWRTRMPEIAGDATVADAGAAAPLLSRRHFVFAVVAQFFYVAAQVGAGAFFINYAVDHVPGLTSERGAYLLSVALGCFLAGRFLTTGLMGVVSAERLLTLYAVVNVLLSGVVILGHGWVSVIALIAMFFFMSIMFPTIFALGVRGLGAQTKRGASFIVMAIAGGAIVPWFMGRIADASDIETSFWIPAACFAIVALYGAYARRHPLD